MLFDTSKGLMILPRDKALALCLGVHTLLRKSPRSLRYAMRVLGRMAAAMEAVPFAQFHLRPLQLAILKSWDRNPFSLDREFRLSANTRRSLHWWLKPTSLARERSFLSGQWKVLTTYASLMGWGAVHLHQSARQVVTKGIDHAHQHPGNSGHLPGVESLPSLAGRLSYQSTVGQCHGSGIREPSRRHPQHPGDDRSNAYPTMGGGCKVGTLCGPHSGCGQLGSRLSQPTMNGLGGMVSPSRSLLSDLSSLGDPGRGSDGIPSQCQGSQFHGQDARSAVARSRCPGSGLDPVPASVHFSTPPPDLQSPEGDQTRGCSHHSDRSRLAHAYMVRRRRATHSRRSLACPHTSRPPVTRPVLPPELRGSQFDSGAIETWVLTQAGFSPDVVKTMIRARKPTSARIYYRTWKIFFTWCDPRGQIPLPYSLPKVLSFLQSGLDAGLSLGSLKSQVSVLSVLFQRRIANKPQVKTFLQGVSRLVPPYKRPLETWDLNLVLTALQSPLFEPLRVVSLRFLSQKVVFLVAITSLRRVSELSALFLQTTLPGFSPGQGGSPYSTILPSEGRVQLPPQ
ncbi:uncharacterized protein [Dendrobates tinctorius]|uniref:uncharacterized protein n=1 Tax=Dendrobates tinctorius TaxID=92724 RepID=UPI003CCA6326